VQSIGHVQPLHVAGWIELQARERSAPTAKLRLAVNPAASVRGPRHIVKSGKRRGDGKPCLDPDHTAL